MLDQTMEISIISIINVAIIIVVVLLSSTVHEYAHALVATKLGDYTAKSVGRLTLNPLKHIDPIGLIAMVVARIGWSKPVPINEANFVKPVRDTALVALAGPISNLFLALVFAGLYHIIPGDLILVQTLIYYFVLINLSLMVFNLIPLPPLDGHRIMRVILPDKIRTFWEQTERYVPFIWLLIFLPFSPLSFIFSAFITTVLSGLLSILGIS